MYREKEIKRQQFNNGYGRKREEDQHTNIFQLQKCSHSEHTFAISKKDVFQLTDLFVSASNSIFSVNKISYIIQLIFEN